jgi:hypothetical protein
MTDKRLKNDQARPLGVLTVQIVIRGRHGDGKWLSGRG